MKAAVAKEAMDGPDHPAGGAVVRVLPGDLVFTGPVGATLLDAARQAGLTWPTICGGVGDCTTCFVQVTEQAGNLSPLTPKERDGLGIIRRRYPGAGEDEIRLACQARLAGDITVSKRGVRRREPSSP